MLFRSSSALVAGVKVPLQVSLSLLSLVIVLSVPGVVPLSRSGTVMSSLENTFEPHTLKSVQTASEKTSVTAMVSPIVSNVSEIVKLSTEGAVVSTLTLELSDTKLCVREIGRASCRERV